MLTNFWLQVHLRLYKTSLTCHEIFLYILKLIHTPSSYRCMHPSHTDYIEPCTLFIQVVCIYFIQIKIKLCTISIQVHVSAKSHVTIYRLESNHAPSLYRCISASAKNKCQNIISYRLKSNHALPLNQHTNAGRLTYMS